MNCPPYEQDTQRLPQNRQQHGPQHGPQDLPCACTHPMLHTLLCRMVHAALPLEPEASEALDALKDTFLDATTALLCKEGIDLDARLVIGLRDGMLTVIDQTHPQAEHITTLLHTAPELSAMLRRIAADAELLRNLKHLERAVERCNAYELFIPCTPDQSLQNNFDMPTLSSIADMPSTQEEADRLELTAELDSYRVCFKGALSHCYRA